MCGHAAPSFQRVRNVSVPARSRTWSTTFAESRASTTLQGQSVPHRGIEPRPTASKAVMRPPHPQGIKAVSRPGIEPGPGPSESPMRSATPSGQTRADDWFRSNMIRFTGPAPFCISHVGISTSVKIRTPCGSFGGCLLSQERHSCAELMVEGLGLRVRERPRHPFRLPTVDHQLSTTRPTQSSSRPR